MKYYTIGEAAAMYHIPESTLRFYEKKAFFRLSNGTRRGEDYFRNVNWRCCKS